MRLRTGRPLRKASSAARWFLILHGAKLPSARHHDFVLADIGANMEHYGCCLHDLSPVITVAGVEHTGVSLRSNRRSDAARFFIDAGGVGGGVLDKSVSRQRADTPLGPSTPASSLLQKAAKNTIGSHRSIEPGYGIIVIP